MKQLPTSTSSEVTRVEPVVASMPANAWGNFGTAEESAENPLKKAHNLLRGRYIITFILALAAAAAGGYAAFSFEQPEYQSVGVVRIRPYVPKVMYEGGGSGIMPMADAFAAWQAQLIRSQRVLEMAMESPTWRKVGKGMTPEEQQEFRENLRINRDPEANLITVAYTDGDPQVAAAAVKSVIEAYMISYGENDLENESKRLRVLEDRRTALANELASLRDRTLTLANEFGSDALDQSYQFKLEQMQKLESALKETQLSLAAAAADLKGGDGSGQTGDDLADDSAKLDIEMQGDAAAGAKAAQNEVADGSGSESQTEETVTPGENLDPKLAGAELVENMDEELSLEQIAVLDPALRALVDRRRGLTREASYLRPSHPDRKDLDDRIAELDSEIENRAMAYRELRAASMPEPSTENPLQRRYNQLTERERRLTELFAESRTETLALGRRKLQIDKLKAEARITEQRLEETKFRIEELRVESAVSGRVEIASSGEVPALPSNDVKRKQLAVLGCFGGGAGGIGLMLLLGLVDTRLRNSEDPSLDDGQVPLLGILPYLPKDLRDPEQASVTAHCVHHIRTLLQLAARRQNKRVFTVTSPAPGTGKSSLTLSLGLSFAASRTKTLLVDADFAGRGLSRRIEGLLPEDTGRNLVEAGVITREQLEEAKGYTESHGLSLEEAIVQLKFATLQDIEAVDEQISCSRIGLFEALEGDDLESCVTSTTIDELSVLTAGAADACDMSRISPTDIRNLVAKVRDQYDMILIDTGPLGGDVGSAIMATETDGVVLVVSRGESRTLAQRSINALRDLGASVDGLVFNRAESRDVQRSQHSGLSSMSRPMHESRQFLYAEVVDAPEVKKTQRFGPMARAVACTTVRRGSKDKKQAREKIASS